MSNQVNYYNHFGEQYIESILKCPEPELWTTDYAAKGKVYEEMKKRVTQQQNLILEYFNKDFPVLDIGCGFGRQATMLAKNGFYVSGTDTSDVFINIANNIFTKNNYKGDFTCLDILNTTLNKQYNQLLLLDVLEHIKPSQRNSFFDRLIELIQEEGVMIMSLPHIKNRLSSKLNNRIRKEIMQHFSYFLKREEHPYPIPEKRDILKLAGQKFSLLKFIESSDTDYYVFRRN